MITRNNALAFFSELGGAFELVSGEVAFTGRGEVQCTDGVIWAVTHVPKGWPNRAGVVFARNASSLRSNAKNASQVVTKSMTAASEFEAQKYGESVVPRQAILDSRVFLPSSILDDILPPAKLERTQGSPWTVLGIRIAPGEIKTIVKEATSRSGFNMDYSPSASSIATHIPRKAISGESEYFVDAAAVQSAMRAANLMGGSWSVAFSVKAGGLNAMSLQGKDWAIIIAGLGAFETWMHPVKFYAGSPVRYESPTAPATTYKTTWSPEFKSHVEGMETRLGGVAANPFVWAGFESPEPTQWASILNTRSYGSSPSALFIGEPVEQVLGRWRSLPRSHDERRSNWYAMSDDGPVLVASGGKMVDKHGYTAEISAAMECLKKHGVVAFLIRSIGLWRGVHAVQPDSGVISAYRYLVILGLADVEVRDEEDGMSTWRFRPGTGRWTRWGSRPAQVRPAVHEGKARWTVAVVNENGRAESLYPKKSEGEARQMALRMQGITAVVAGSQPLGVGASGGIGLGLDSKPAGHGRTYCGLQDPDPEYFIGHMAYEDTPSAQ